MDKIDMQIAIIFSILIISASAPGILIYLILGQKFYVGLLITMAIIAFIGLHKTINKYEKIEG
jgi:hypothetical protein